MIDAVLSDRDKGYIEFAYDMRIRNAFSHSQYKLRESGFYMTKYDSEISYEDLNDKVMGLYYLLSFTINFMKDERQEFIEKGVAEEDGYYVYCQTKDNMMSVGISNHWPIKKG